MKTVYTLLFALCTIVCCTAQPVVEKFIGMPDELQTLLNEAQRRDMITQWRTGQNIATPNKAGGESRITQLSDSLLLLSLTERSELQIRLFPLKDSTCLIGTIHTVFGPAGDSRFQLYDADWEPVGKTAQSIRPTIDEFLIFPDSIPVSVRREVRDHITIPLFVYTFRPDGNIEIRPSWNEYLSEEARKKVAPFLSDTPAVRRYRNGAFRK